MLLSRSASCTLLAAVAGLCLGVAPGRAAAAVPLCLGALQTEGLAEDREQETRRLVAAQLEALDVEIPVATQTVELEPGCFAVPACVVKRMQGLGVVGVLDLLVRRVGPLVHVRMRMFDADKGHKVFETEFTTPAKSYPQPDQFHDDLRRALDALLVLHPEVTRAEPGAAPAADEGSVWQPLSWGVLGVGGLALLGGAAAGGYWLMLSAQLSPDCEGGECVRGEDVDAGQEAAYTGLGWAAPILMGSGLVLASLGVAGLLLAPGEEADEGETAQAEPARLQGVALR